jgi:PAS domain S-box-containing protein
VSAPDERPLSSDRQGTPPHFVSGDDEMSRRIREHDWTHTPLGPLESWGQSLKTLVGLILASGQPMFIAWGRDRNWLYNDAFIPIMGLKHPTSLGASLLEVWREAAADLSPLFDRVFSGQSVQMDDIGLQLDRRGFLEEAHFAFSYMPARDETGAVMGLFGACVETTEKMLAEQRQKAASDRQRQMFEQAPSFICLLQGPDHVFEFLNQAHRRLFNSDDWVGKPVREAFPDLEGQGYFELLDQVYSSGQRHVAHAAQVQFRRTPDSPMEERLLDFVYEPVTDDQGRVTGIFCEGFDTSETRRAEEALRKSEARLRLAMAAGGQGAWELDFRTRWLALSDETKRQLGRSPDDVIDYDALRLCLHEDDRERIGQALDRSVATGTDFNEECRCVRADGTIGWLQISGKVDFQGEEAARMVGVSSDITGRKTIELDLLALNETLEKRVAERSDELMIAEEALRHSQKMEAIGQLTGGVAHDFNNLLTVILSSADLLRRGQLSEERRLRYIDAISDTADRAAKLTGQLLAFARRQTLKPEKFDALACVRDFASMAQTVLGSRIVVDIQATCDMCPVEVDRAQFETALVNMAVNARDAMDGEGRLTILIEDRPDMPARRGRAPPQRDAVAVSVRDTGTGISPDDLDRIFEPFFTTKAVGKGTGLGLSQVYGFAKQSGGEIDVTSVPGNGATFTIYLPRAEPPDTTTAAPAPVLHAPSKGRILVVEDNPQVGGFAVDLLEDIGYQPTLAVSAEDALGALERAQGQFDLVFTDVVMPGIGGIELADRIKHRWPSLPVVLTSGYSDVLAEDRRHGFNLLHKPYSVTDLTRVISQTLSRAD